MTEGESGFKSGHYNTQEMSGNAFCALCKLDSTCFETASTCNTSLWWLSKMESHVYCLTSTLYIKYFQVEPVSCCDVRLEMCLVSPEWKPVILYEQLIYFKTSDN